MPPSANGLTNPPLFMSTPMGLSFAGATSKGGTLPPLPKSTGGLAKLLEPSGVGGGGGGGNMMEFPRFILLFVLC